MVPEASGRFLQAVEKGVFDLARTHPFSLGLQRSAAPHNGTVHELPDDDVRHDPAKLNAFLVRLTQRTKRPVQESDIMRRLHV